MILCILKAEMPFKMHKIIFFSRKYVCLPYLKFSDQLPKNTYFFLFGLSRKESRGQWEELLLDQYQG